MRWEVAWGIVEAGEAVDNEGRAIWHISLSLRKHLASTWPRQEQKSHLGQFEALFCKFWEEDGEEEDAGDVEGFWKALGGAKDAENVEEVEERLAHVWSMFQSAWITEGLSNLSRTEMVHTTSSKEWGSALMMAMTASSS